jgi:hypothetical protein
MPRRNGRDDRKYVEIIDFEAVLLLYSSKMGRELKKRGL